MRTRTALFVVGLAATLGTATGALVLPDRGVAPGNPGPTGRTPSAASPSGSASPSPSLSPRPSRSGQGALLEANLLSTADFRAVGISVTSEPADVRLEPVVCEETQSLDDIADSGPPVQRVWEAESIVASEQAVSAQDADQAKDIVTQVLRTLEACQTVAPKRWVYGPTHSERLGAATTASWLGTVNGTLNTTGRAPKGEMISGGIAVLRNGSHVAVFDISWCASAGDGGPCVVANGEAYGQLAALSRAAARRLG